MKKFIGTIILSAVVCTLAALETGDEAREIKSKFYNGKIFKAKFYMVDKRNQNKLKILVFARLLADDFAGASALIENIGNRKNVSLAFATPDEDEISVFLKQNSSFKYALLHDKKAHDEYMNENIIYPRAFVINYENKIIWDGEFIDLPDMLDKFEAGKYDFEKNRKINRYLAQMQDALRSGSEYQLDRAARDILALDHGNAACLRLRLFAFENTNRPEDAWNFLEEYRRRYPDEKYLYMLQVDLGARYPFLADKSAAVGMVFLQKKLGNASDKLLMAWLFLNNYPLRLNALQCAEQLLALLSEKSFTDISMQSLYCRALALCCYRYCDLAGAVKNQQRACEILNNGENKEILKYYQKLSEK